MLEEKLLEPFFEIILSEDIGYYEGDKLIVLKNRDNDYGWRAADDDDVWGFLVSGYGSCSGCDAWEAAYTGKDRFGLLNDEVSSIKWFPTLAKLQEFVSDKYSTELQWWGNESEFKDFVKKVSELTDSKGETDG